MPPRENSPSIPHETVREHLLRINSSSVLAGSNRLTRFLEFVVEKKLAGHEDAIQEYVIGLEVFDRKGSFDPRIDSIVRVEARRLRKKLAEYYRSEGTRDAVRIELPPRGYVPQFFEKESAQRVGWTPRLLAVAVIAGVGLGTYFLPGLFRTGPGEVRADISIGVLPFANHSGQSDMDFLAEGFTDKLITDLAKIDALRVISHNSMKRYGDGTRSSREIAEKLGLDYLIEGGILRSGPRMRVTVQLIDAGQDRHVWAADYERDAEEVIAVQRALSRDVVREIAVKLTPGVAASMDASMTASREAYESYLKG